ncbi:MAG: hypothetical protein ACHQKY_12590, partial [Terriglobia bacterium]
LAKLFEKNSMLVDGKACKAAHAVEWNDEKEMSSVLYYLIENHGVLSVQKLFETDLAKYEANSRRGQDGAHAATEIFQSLGVRYVSPWESQQQGNSFYFHRTLQLFPLDVRTYDYLVESNFRPQAKFSLFGQTYTSRLKEAKLQILEDESPILEFDLSNLIQRLKQSSTSSSNHNLPPDQFAGNNMEVDIESDLFKAKLYLKEINGEEEKGQLRLTSVSGLLLLKKK